MIAILELHKRPVVLFDATKAQHRKWYAEFIKTNSWGNCPVRFAVKNQNGFQESIIPDIAHQVMSFYMNKEFNKRPKKYGAKALPQT